MTIALIAALVVSSAALVTSVIVYRRSKAAALAALKRSDEVLVMLSPGRQITDPDEAEALGLTADARRMREGHPMYKRPSM